MTAFRLDHRTPTFPAADRFWIAESAIVIGDVTFAEETSVWFGAVVRADDETIVIGEGTNIQDNAVLHADPALPIRIGTYCTIGHGAIVHGCTIGNDTLIGMGSRVLNGARVGDRCLIGAGAIVSEGVTIPDDSLVVGIPGKVVRAVDPEMLRRIRLSATNYVMWWKRFRDGLAPVELPR